MDADRKRELRASLEHRLNIKSQELRFSPAERAAWVAEHLEEYVDRWLGLLGLSAWSWQEIIDHDLFGTVELASELLTRELRSAEPTRELLLAWVGFLALMDDVRNAGERDRAPLLLDSIREVRSHIR